MNVNSILIRHTWYRTFSGAWMSIRVTSLNYISCVHRDWYLLIFLCSRLVFIDEITNLYSVFLSRKSSVCYDLALPRQRLAQSILWHRYVVNQDSSPQMHRYIIRCRHVHVLDLCNPPVFMWMRNGGAVLYSSLRYLLLTQYDTASRYNWTWAGMTYSFAGAKKVNV